MNGSFFRISTYCRVLATGVASFTDNRYNDAVAVKKSDSFQNFSLLNGTKKYDSLAVNHYSSGLKFRDLARECSPSSADDNFNWKANKYGLHKTGVLENRSVCNALKLFDIKDVKLPNAKPLNDKSGSTLSIHIEAYEKSLLYTKDVAVKLPEPKFDFCSIKPLSFFEYPRHPSSEIETPEIMQFKASQKLLNPNEPTCCFNAPIISVYESKPRPSESLVSRTCSGPLTKFDQLNERSEFPNVTEKEVILARGGGQFKLDLSNEHISHQTNNLYICVQHRNELSLKWDLRKYHHSVMKRKKAKGDDISVPVCSLPAPFGENHENKADRPETCRYAVSFDEAAAFLETNGILIHPGIPVCEKCAKYLKTLLTRDVPLKKMEENSTEDDDLVEVDITSERASKSIANALMHDYYKNEPADDDDNTVNQSDDQRVTKLIEELAALTGIGMANPYKTFDVSKRDTQQRKAKQLQQFQQLFAKHLAPDNPEALIQLANKEKIGPQKSAKELRMENLMLMIKAQYLAAESKNERISVLSQIALEVPLEEFKKVIPGISKYQWSTARQRARERIENEKTKPEQHIRVKYDRASIDIFLEFITSPAVMAGLPYGTKVGKLPDGRKFDIPSTLRKQDDSEIIRMFENYVQEKGINVKISHTVMRNILKVCPAVRMKALECVDYFESTGKNAFDKIINRLEKLSNMNLIDEEWQKELQQELLEAKLYLRTDYRLHISEKSQVAEHCMNHSLSDPKNREYRSSSCRDDTEFPHSHNGSCDRCQVFPQAMQKIRAKINELLGEEEKTKDDHVKLAEMMEEMEVYENDIIEWKKHAMRSAFSEKCRLEIIAQLKEGEALVTGDYMQKWIPRHYRESQRDYFGKKGLSCHITHILLKKDGKLVQHTIVHNLGHEEQNSNAVSAILTDVLSKCKSWGINSVVLRSDNAGYYRNSALINSIPSISEKTGVFVKAYTFSEPQAGKGPSDREGARIKWRMICALNSGYNITTSEEMFLAMTYGQKRLEGITVVTAVVSGDAKDESTSIPGISYLSHVEYDAENGSFKIWKHHGVGEGKKMKVENAALNNELVISSSTSETPSSDGYVFWRETGSVVEKQKQKKDKADANRNENDDEDEDEDSDEETTYKMFHCPDPNCIKKYVRYSNLCNHIESGKHEYRPLKKTLYDYAITKFGEHLDDLKERHLQLYARETFQEFVTTNDTTVDEGWALRSKAKNKRFSNDVHEFVDELLVKCMHKKKRFDPKIAEEAMENAKKSNGNSRFKPSERLNATQLSGLAQRKLKKLESRGNKSVSKKTLEADRNLITDEIEADTGDFQLEYEDDPTNVTILEALNEYVTETGVTIENEITNDGPTANQEASNSATIKTRKRRQLSTTKTRSQDAIEMPPKKARVSKSASHRQS